MADDEDDDDGEKHHGDLVVPPLVRGDGVVQPGRLFNHGVTWGYSIHFKVRRGK